MRAFVGVAAVVVCASCFLFASTHAFPAQDESDSDSNESADRKNVDTVLIMPNQGNPLGIPTSLDYPSYSGFGGFYDGHRFVSAFNSYVKSLMSMLQDVFASSQDGNEPWGKIPEGANTTSVTKNIDGHVVTINETTYSHGDDIQRTVVRVRVIDVKPQNETILVNESGEEAENTTPSRSIETVEDFDNEIPKNQVDTLTA